MHDWWGIRLEMRGVIKFIGKLSTVIKYWNAVKTFTGFTCQEVKFMGGSRNLWKVWDLMHDSSERVQPMAFSCNTQHPPPPTLRTPYRSIRRDRLGPSVVTPPPPPPPEMGFAIYGFGKTQTFALYVGRFDMRWISLYIFAIESIIFGYWLKKIGFIGRILVCNIKCWLSV